MPAILTNVDQRQLRATKFPPAFDKKVDTSKLNMQLIRNWVTAEITKILGYDDDVVVGMAFEMLESQKNPNIKAFQIQLGGFLETNAPKFCEDLWELCLSGQENGGVPKQLLEAKKQEIMREEAEREIAAEARRKRDEEQDARGRELDSLRNQERRDRGGRDDRGRGYGGRDYDRRPARRHSRSPSPYRRRSDDSYRRSAPRDRPAARDIDTYIPKSGRHHGRARSRSPVRRSESRDRGNHRRDTYGDRAGRRRRDSSPTEQPAKKASSVDLENDRIAALNSGRFVSLRLG